MVVFIFSPLICFLIKQQNGTWFNSSDQAGSIMSALVWVLMLYSSVTVTLLTITEGIPVTCGMVYNILCFMATVTANSNILYLEAI